MKRNIKITISEHPPDIEYLIRMLAEMYIYEKKAVAPTTTKQK
ncbi:MAG: hypothetical protein ACLRT4_13715 [Thomasclavelia sp.]